MKAICLFVTAILFANPIFSQNSAELTLNLEVNKVYRLKSSTVQNTTQSVMGAEQSSQTHSIVVLALKPLKKTDEGTIAEIRFDTIHTKISQPAMDINSVNQGDINSSDPGKVMECILHRMSNSTFLARISNTGRVMEFMNFAPVKASILQGVDSLKGPTGEFLKQRAEMIAEEKAVKSMIEMATVYLPGTNVKQGGNWNISLLIYGGGMGMNQNSKYKLVSTNENTSLISAELAIESAPGTMDMGGAKISSDLRGLGKAELKIDTKTGWIISGEFKQQMKGDILVNAQGNNMTIPTEINTTGSIVALP